MLFFKLRMATGLNAIGKHNFYDHLTYSNKIHSPLMVLMHLIKVRRSCNTPYCTRSHFKRSRLGPRSYSPKPYIIALFLTIPKLSFYFLQVFWLWSNIVSKNLQIWSWHPVYLALANISFLRQTLSPSLYLYKNPSIHIKILLSI